MGAATQVTDLADLRRDLLGRIMEAVGVSATNTIADRFINIALHDMHIDPGSNFPWAIRRAYLTTHAPYTTGTVSIAAATRTTVAGSSTLWNTAVTGFGFNNTRVGGKMTFSGSNDVHEVTVVTSDVAITITPQWVGSALSAASYAYFEDEYALASDFGRPVDLRSFSTDANIPLIGPQLFRRTYPRNYTRRKPRVATLIQLGFSGSTTARYRVVLAPVPDDEYIIPYDYITTNLAVTAAGVEQTQLTADTDEPIVPLKYRHAIAFHALYHWYRDRKDDTRSGEAKGEYTDIMKRISGETIVGQDRPRFAPSNAKYFGPYRSGRFDIGDRFDDLRDRWWK